MELGSGFADLLAVGPLLRAATPREDGSALVRQRAPEEGGHLVRVRVRVRIRVGVRVRVGVKVWARDRLAAHLRLSSAVRVRVRA